MFYVNSKKKLLFLVKAFLFCHVICIIRVRWQFEFARHVAGLTLRRSPSGSSLLHKTPSIFSLEAAAVQANGQTSKRLFRILLCTIFASGLVPFVTDNAMRASAEFETAAWIDDGTTSSSRHSPWIYLFSRIIKVDFGWELEGWSTLRVSHAYNAPPHTNILTLSI